MNVELTSGGGGKTDPQCMRSRGGSCRNESKSCFWLKVHAKNGGNFSLSSENIDSTLCQPFLHLLLFPKYS